MVWVNLYFGTQQRLIYSGEYQRRGVCNQPNPPPLPHLTCRPVSKFWSAVKIKNWIYLWNTVTSLSNKIILKHCFQINKLNQCDLVCRRKFCQMEQRISGIFSILPDTLSTLISNSNRTKKCHELHLCPGLHLQRCGHTWQRRKQVSSA